MPRRTGAGRIGLRADMVRETAHIDSTGRLLFGEEDGKITVTVVSEPGCGPIANWSELLRGRTIHGEFR